MTGDNSAGVLIMAYRLMTASEAYHRVLSKTKASEALTEEEKMLPVDSLGLVMIGHGEEFKDDSMFGASRVAYSSPLINCLMLA